VGKLLVNLVNQVVVLDGQGSPDRRMPFGTYIISRLNQFFLFWGDAKNEHSIPIKECQGETSRCFLGSGSDYDFIYSSKCYYMAAHSMLKALTGGPVALLALTPWPPTTSVLDLPSPTDAPPIK
jgi:hypothetical protein